MRQLGSAVGVLKGLQRLSHHVSHYVTPPAAARQSAVSSVTVQFAILKKGFEVERQRFVKAFKFTL
jgi:hypothetical protein